MSDLKPCPFCGSKNPEILEIETPYITIRTFAIVCVVCDCSVEFDLRNDADEMTSAWNRREVV